MENYKNEYLDWLNSLIKEIFENLEQYEVDIILFPEYFLPLDASPQIKNTVLEFSYNKCIVTGVGVINSDKNRFALINSKKIQYGEKVALNHEEKSLKFIKDGNGPLIHDIKIKDQDRNEINIPVLVAMCSDLLDLGTSPGLFSDVMSEELNKKGLRSADIKAIFCPSFSPKTAEINNFLFSQVGRKWRICLLANCSFGGNSSIQLYPYDDKKVLIGKQKTLEKGESGFIIADIPYPSLQIIQPKSKIIGDHQSIPTFKDPQVYNFEFLDEIKSSKDQSRIIKLDVTSFSNIIYSRLTKAILYTTIFLSGNSSCEESKEMFKIINLWKKLQDEMKKQKQYRDILGYSNLPEIIFPLYEKVFLSEDPYIAILEIFKELANNNDDIKMKIEEIQQWVSEYENLPNFQHLLNFISYEKRRELNN